MAEVKPGADPQALARDWITIVQSELSGLAADREAQEHFALMLGLWAAVATTMVNAWPKPGARGGRDGHPAGAPAPPGTAPAPVASDPRDAEIRHLAARVAELERRLAGTGVAGGKGSNDPAKPRRRRKP